MKMVNNNKRAKIGIVSGIIIGFFVLVYLAYFVFATHVATPSTGGVNFNINEDVEYVFNVTVNNTNVNANGNITQVNITLPGGFSYKAGSNQTNGGTSTFVNTSDVLSWSNTSLVMNIAKKNFKFNLTASNPGVYNLTIISVNATGAYYSNISIIVNDTTAPSVSVPVSPLTNGNYSGNLLINVSINDSTSVNYVFFNLTDSTGFQNATFIASNSAGDYWNATIITSDFADGVYNLSIYANDSLGRLNKTIVVNNILFDNTKPIVTLMSPADAVSSTTTAYNFTFNVTESNYISACNLVISGSYIQALTGINFTGGTNGIDYASLSVTTHIWSINCTDSAGNVGNSSLRTLNVSSSSSSSSSSSGAGITRSFWTRTFAEDKKEMNETKEVTKELRKKERMRILIDGEKHYVGVVTFTDTRATINISSTSQQTTLDVGYEKKFEVNDDNYYDLLIKLNNIVPYSRVNLTVTYLHEEILGDLDNKQKPSQAINATGNVSTDQNSQIVETDKWSRGQIIAIVIVVLIIVIGIGAYWILSKRE